MVEDIDKTLEPIKSWCDCPEGYPSYGIGKYKHLTSCRYGVVFDYLDAFDRTSRLRVEASKAAGVIHAEFCADPWNSEHDCAAKDLREALK